MPPRTTCIFDKRQKSNYLAVAVFVVVVQYFLVLFEIKMYLCVCMDTLHEALVMHRTSNRMKGEPALVSYVEYFLSLSFSLVGEDKKKQLQFVVSSIELLSPCILHPSLHFW